MFAVLPKATTSELNKPENERDIKNVCPKVIAPSLSNITVSHIEYISQPNHTLNVGRFGFQTILRSFEQPARTILSHKNNQVLVSTNGMFILYGMPKRNSLFYIATLLIRK